MSDKKQILVGFKISEDERPLFESIAENYGLKPGALAGVLFRKFIDAKKTHGSDLKYPPEFDYYESESHVMKKKNDPANELSKQKAG